MERATLRPLPPRPYEFALWTRPKVNIDYHVEFEEHYYSVPWQLRGERLDLRATATTVETLSARAARGEPRAQPRQAPAEHRLCAHAGRAPRPPRVVPAASDRLGRDRRAGAGRPHGGDHAAAPAPRAGLPRLPRPHASPEALPGRAARAGLRPRAALPGLLLQERGRHPEPPPRRGRPPDHHRPAADAPPPRQHPRVALLPLKGVEPVRAKNPHATVCRVGTPRGPPGFPRAANALAYHASRKETGSCSSNRRSRNSRRCSSTGWSARCASGRRTRPPSRSPRRT